MRRLLFSVALVPFVISTSAFANGSSKRLIVSDSDLDGASASVQNSGGGVIRKMDHLNALVVELPVQALNGLKKKLPNAEIIEDSVLALGPIKDAGKPGGGGGTPPPQSTPWGVTRIQSREANAISRGAGVKVCVVDTGVDRTHPDLSANIIGGRNFVVIRGSVNPASYGDDNGHGTHVSGTVAALDNAIGSVGVAPDAKILAMKVLDRRGSGYLSDITDGVYECIAQGAHVINMSLGGSGDPAAPSPFKTAVEAAIANGIKVVVAAGNEGADISGKVPAGFAGVVAVAATDINNAFPSWSNFGLSTDGVSAPGVSVYSTWLSGGYNTISGTSMASPHTAGVVALAIAAGKIALVTEDLGQPVSRQGAGLVNALSTVTAP